MDALVVFPEENDRMEYPKHVIDGVMKSLHQADSGDLTPYTGIGNMIDNSCISKPEVTVKPASPSSPGLE